MSKKINVLKGLASIIVITVAHRSDQIKNCIKNIKRLTPEPHEIILVSNGIPDKTINWLRKRVKEDPGIKIIEGHVNLNYAKTCNLAIQASSGEYIVLLMNDVVVTEGWLPGMIECLKSSQDIGIVGPMTSNIDGPQGIENDQIGAPEHLDEFARAFREKNRYRRVGQKILHEFCMVFSRNAWENIGLLDEQFRTPEYSADDYCLRASVQNYRNCIVGDVFVYCRGDSALSDVIALRKLTLSHNRELFADKKLFTDKWRYTNLNEVAAAKLFAMNAMSCADELNWKDQINEAVAVLIEGIKYIPEEKDLHYSLVNILIENKQIKSALAILDHMPAHFKQDVKWLELAGYCKEGLGLSMEAERHADEILSLNKASPKAWNLKGIVSYKKMHFTVAENYLHKALEFDKSMGETYANLASIKWNTGMRDEALDFFETAFIHSPTDKNIIHNFHSAAVSLSDLERAERDFHDAVIMFPSHKRIHQVLVDILLRGKKYKEAVKCLEETMLAFGIDDKTLSLALGLREKAGPKEIDKTSRGTISLCMIVRNKENNIAGCLHSIGPLADEMIVVDTGSTDKTKDIAKAFGAKVYDFLWKNDLSEARKFSLPKASGEWILVLDADETIAPFDQKVLKEMISLPENKSTAFTLTTRNYEVPGSAIERTATDGSYIKEEAGTGWFPTSKVRIFPNNPHIRFEPSVHAFVENSLKKVGVRNLDIEIPVHRFFEPRQKPSAVDTIEYYGPKVNQKTTRIRKISFLVSPFDEASKRYRVYNLIEELTEKGIECYIFQETDVNRLDLFLDSDLLVIFRLADSSTADFIVRKIRERHIPIIFDIDDLIFDHECLRFFDGLHYMTPVEQQLFRQGISRWREMLLKSDYVTCTSDTIVSYVRKTGKEAFVIKNTINHEQFNLSNTLIRNERRHSGESIKIGYFSGTHTHNKDFMGVSDALYEILKEHPSVEFHVVGHLDLEEKFSYFGQRVVRQPLMPYPDYLKYQFMMDINLAPLEMNNPFTDAKSELKIFEAALVGVPTVASPTASYKNCITDGVDGFLAGTKKEWYEKLSLLVENSSLRKRISETARKSFLERYYNGYVIDDVIRIYEGILDHYHAAHPKSSRTFILPEKLPMFSIVSILYRKEDQIEYFLKSFLRQSYPGSFELIFVDDRSPDNSVKAVQDFLAKRKEEKPHGIIPEVRVIQNDKNLGNCTSRNIGIQNARGDIVIVIDADCIVNRDFLSAHAEAYAYGDCEVAVGPFNLETNGQDPFAVLEAYENNSARVKNDAQLQDTLNARSFLNCITRNFSIRKEYIPGDLFDVSFSYSEDGKSGFGWEDIDMGYGLYKRGARIKFVSEAFSVHISHPSSVDEKIKPLRSLKNFRKLYEKHPELLLVARSWTLDTYQKICQWADHYRHERNDDRLYLDNLFQRFLPSPFSIKRSARKLKILTYRWHCSHQYELYKLPHEFTLATGLGTCITDYWEYDKRPLPPNAHLKTIREIRVEDYDLAILHFDENVLSPENTNGVIAPAWRWGETIKWFRNNVKLPMVAICHGTPQFYGQYNIHYKEPNLMQVMETEREKIVHFMGDVLVIANSHQAQREWAFKKSKVIWHGFDPTEFYPAEYKRGILAMLEQAMINRPHYNGYFVFREVFRDFPAEYRPKTLSVAEPKNLYERNTNAYAYARFRNYIDEIRQYSVYFNPTLRSPMPRSRGEAMMCGLVTVSTNNHDVEFFIKNGVNGFYSNEPYELREYLLYLMKNTSKCKKIGMEGRKTAMDIFNHDRYLKAWEETISEVLR